MSEKKNSSNIAPNYVAEYCSYEESWIDIIFGPADTFSIMRTKKKLIFGAILSLSGMHMREL